MAEHIAEPLQPLRVPIQGLNYDPANARRHGEKNLDAIKASLAKFGQRKPIVVQREGMIVRAGNGTLAAAKALGWSEIAAVILDDDNSTASQFAIADNRTAELAEWDTETLTSLLDGWDEDTREMLGFDAKDVKELLADITPEIVEDEVPEPPADPITKPGDLWLLGDHRVMCGDSTKAVDVKRLMIGAKADLIWTDPPYGVNHVGGTKDPRRKTHRSGGIVYNDDKTGNDLVAMVSAAIGAIAKHDASVLYVASPAGSNVREMIDAFNGSGFEFRHSLVWVKHAFVFGRADYHYKHELILYGWAERHEWIGSRDTSTVFEFPRGDKTVEHPTSKPVGLVVETAKNHPAKLMADPFLGSGTTLIAAEQLGRTCYGMEISPAYCDVIVKRWETLTGKKAQLAKS